MAPLYQATRRMLLLCILMSLVALAACPAVFAQITVTNATFPVAGTTLRMAVASNRALGYSVITPPGGDQVWDLSGLQPEALRNTTFQPANLGAAAVPGAELFAALAPFQEEYYNVTPTIFELQAYYGTYPYSGNSRIVNTNPPLPMRHAPMNFFDLNVYSSTTTDVFATSELDSILRIRLEIPSTVDSIRYIEDLSQLDVVNAWGSLSIPGGTYNVLRLKRTLYRRGKLFGKVASIGWLNMQAIIGDRAELYGNSFPGIPVDTTTSYHFFNDLEKEPIAVVTLRSLIFNTPPVLTQVMYKFNSNCVPPATSAISGTSSACPNQTGMGYSVTNTIGSTYAWTISGGTQALGTNTSSITVNWGAAGPGMVSVVETNAGLCVGAAVNLPVTVATGTCESKQSGDWNDTGTWACGRVPLLCDKVTIRGPHVVSLSQSVQVAGLEMKDNGQLSLVGGNVQIGNL